MITKRELQDIARLRGLSLGNAEKDYCIDLALLSITAHTKRELVFKGGTCLYKFHKLNRFSEDIDFSAAEGINANELIGKVLRDFERFGVNAKIHKIHEPRNSVLATLRAEGPLFDGKPISIASLGIDINFASPVIMPTEVLSYNPVYQDIPPISVLCMAKEEIFAEKIRALMTRKRARDLFDIYFLLLNKIIADRTIIQQKLDYYNKTFDLQNLLQNIRLLEPMWQKELMGFAKNLPEFSVVKKFVSQTLEKAYKQA